MTDQTAIVQVESSYLAPVAAVETILRAYQAKKDLIEKVLRSGVDYGPIPGSDKPALKKPGAEKMSNFFGLMPTFDDVRTIEDWTGADHNGEPFFYYRQRANMWRVINGERVLVASADGSCNSWEKKYRYRQSERVCPSCGKPAIIKGKAEYGGGWVCFAKKGGCGAKYQDGDQAIEGQQVGQVKNTDIAEQVNTVLKMAQKRALVAATLIATGASDYFTQDIEDFIEGEYHDPEPPRQQPVLRPAAPNNAKQFNPVQFLVDKGISENNNAAAGLMTHHVPANLRNDPNGLLAWGKLYRAWRDLGSEPEAAAKNATEGVPVE